MKSPVLPNVDMRRVTLDEGLPAWECPGSGGHWINGEDYRTWLERHGPALPMKPPAAGFDVRETPETSRARICPETGRLLTRYRVGQGLSFTIDFSAATGGVWLDKHEWNALKSRNLHDDIHLIFTAAWQKQLRDEQRETELRQHFEERIGPAFPRVAEFKTWLREQPNQRDILIFLGEQGL